MRKPSPPARCGLFSALCNIYDPTHPRRARLGRASETPRYDRPVGRVLPLGKSGYASDAGADRRHPALFPRRPRPPPLAASFAPSARAACPQPAAMGGDGARRAVRYRRLYRQFYVRRAAHSGGQGGGTVFVKPGSDAAVCRLAVRRTAERAHRRRNGAGGRRFGGGHRPGQPAGAVARRHWHGRDAHWSVRAVLDGIHPHRSPRARGHGRADHDRLHPAFGRADAAAVRPHF